MATHSNILAWQIPWTEEPGRVYSTESQQVMHANPIENFSIPAETITTIVTAHHWKCVRLKRDRLIVVTDVWVWPDRTPSAAQLAYRQALRDITTQADPDDITWPVKPS